jgi:hypothetical protein
MMAIQNKRGITVSELRALIRDWPEFDRNGEPSMVFIETGMGLSGPCVEASTLNLYEEFKDGESVYWHADLYLGFSGK